MTIKPFSTYPETREEMLRLSAEIEKARTPEETEPHAIRLADLVSGILKDEKYAEEKGTYDDDWRPIETAPKDGTPVLLHGGRDDNAGFGRTGTTDEIAMKSPCRAWWSGDDWVITLAEAGCVACCRLEPTNWQPLPTPPKKTGE
jgi:hypothetical protein